MINGVDMNDRSSFTLSGGGDINGDGLDDIIIGASEAEPNGVATDNRGASYVVFGKSDGAIVELSEIDEGNDNNGFVINGAMMGDLQWFSGQRCRGTSTAMALMMSSSGHIVQNP